VPRAALAVAVPDGRLGDPLQRERCLDSLVADGLVEPLAGDRLALPG
jgi:A/G-specific adenine glycosylase